MKEVAKGHSELVAKPAFPGLSEFSHETRLIYEDEARQQGQKAKENTSGKAADDDDISLSYISSWSAAVSDAGLGTAENAAAPSPLASPSLSTPTTQVDEIPPINTHASRLDTVTPSGIPPSTKSKAPSATPEAPLSCKVLVPYEATIFGLDKARRDCKSEMAKIVNEVDVNGVVSPY